MTPREGNSLKCDRACNLPTIKRTKAKNKVAEKILPLLGSHNEKESQQSAQHLLNEFNSFSVKTWKN